MLRIVFHFALKIDAAMEVKEPEYSRALILDVFIKEVKSNAHYAR